MELRKLTKKKKKDGAITDMMIWLVVGFITVILFGLWIYGFNTITVELEGIGNPGNINLSEAVEGTFSQINEPQAAGLRTLSWVMMISMALTIMLSNFFIKSHPSFFVVYIFIVVAGIIAAVLLSNYYETLLNDNLLGATFSEFTASNFILLHLPTFMTVIGIMGAIFLFAGIMRDRGSGGAVV